MMRRAIFFIIAVVIVAWLQPASAFTKNTGFDLPASVIIGNQLSARTTIPILLRGDYQGLLDAGNTDNFSWNPSGSSGFDGAINNKSPIGQTSGFDLKAALQYGNTQQDYHFPFFVNPAVFVAGDVFGGIFGNNSTFFGQGNVLGNGTGGDFQINSRYRIPGYTFDKNSVFRWSRNDLDSSTAYGVKAMDTTIKQAIQEQAHPYQASIYSNGNCQDFTGDRILYLNNTALFNDSGQPLETPDGNIWLITPCSNDEVTINFSGNVNLSASGSKGTILIGRVDDQGKPIGNKVNVLINQNWNNDGKNIGLIVLKGDLNMRGANSNGATLVGDFFVPNGEIKLSEGWDTKLMVEGASVANSFSFSRKVTGDSFVLFKSNRQLLNNPPPVFKTLFQGTFSETGN